MGFTGELAGGSNLLKCLIMEGLGTFIYAYVQLSNYAPTSGKSKMFGITGGDLPVELLSIISVAGWVIFPLSGAHLNPCLTIGYMVKNKMPVVKGAYYLLVQLLATFIAALILFISMPIPKDSDLRTRYWDAKMPGPLGGLGTKHAGIMLFEFIGTFILILLIFAINLGKGADKPSSAFLIGCSYAFCVSMIYVFTKGTLNPYFYLVPRLLIFKLKYIHFYLLGTLGGAIAAAFAYEPFLGDYISEGEDAPEIDLQ